MIDIEINAVEQQLENLYLDWIEDYCNVVFNPTNLPGGVNLALKEMVKTDPMSYNVVSEKLSDMSVTYSSSGDVPVYIKRWLEPYKRVKLLSDKEKRIYGR